MSVFSDSGYISIRQQYNDWWVQSHNEPIIDRHQVAYAWIIEGSTPLVEASDVYWSEERVVQAYDADVAQDIAEENFIPATEDAPGRPPGAGSIYKPEDDGAGNNIYPLIIDQDSAAIQDIKEIAISKLIEFYNKEDDDGQQRDWVRSSLRSNSLVKFVEWTERPDPGGVQDYVSSHPGSTLNPKTPVPPIGNLASTPTTTPAIWFYCVVDARTFDDLMPAGAYKLTTVSENANPNADPPRPNDTLHALAKKYKKFFQVVGGSDKAQRSRIAEILKANGIRVGELRDIATIQDWIRTINEPVFNYDEINQHPEYDEFGEVWVTDPDLVDPSLMMPPDSFFSKNATIYLPNPEPPQPPSPAHVVSLPIGQIDNWIAHLDTILEKYEEQVFRDGNVVENFNFAHQRTLLSNFDSGIIKHFSFNNIEKKYVRQDNLEIFFNSDYKVIYMFLNVAGEPVPLIQGLSALFFQSPFGDKRTMSLISHLEEIQQISFTNDGYPDLDYGDFFKDETYVSPPVVVRSTQPANPLDQLKKKSQSVAELLAEKFDKLPYKTDNILDAEDESIGNSRYMEAVQGQAMSDVTFTGDLIISNLSNIQGRIAVSGGAVDAVSTAYSLLLNKLSIDVLMKAAIECLLAQIPFSCEDVVKSVLGDLPNGYLFFKQSVSIELQPLVDEAYAEANGSGDDFLVILEAKIQAEGSIEFDTLIEDVCAILMNLFTDPAGLFKIPLLFFPDDLPTIDIMASLTLMLQSAIIEMIVALIMGLITTIVDAILGNCSSVMEVFPDNDFGNADIAGAVASRAAGGDALANALEAFFDALGDAAEDADMDLDEEAIKQQELAGDIDSTPEDEIDEPIECDDGMVWDEAQGACIEERWIDLDPTGSSWEESTYTSGPSAIMAKVEAAKLLLDDISAVLTPAEIMALFDNSAQTVVYETVLNLLKLPRHEVLSKTLTTPDDIKLFFTTLGPLVNLKPILGQIKVINTQLGCTWESVCERINNISVKWNDLTEGEVTKIVGEKGKQKRKLVLDLMQEYPGDDPGGPGPGGPETGRRQIDTFCQEGRFAPDKSLIPKDNASLIFLLEKVIDVMYDGIYMSFDQEITKLADSMAVIVSEPKLIPRVIDKDKAMKIEIFNMTKLQREDILIDFPDWMPKGKAISPEFRRLLGTGYTPAIGDEEGKYGPYTTLKAQTEETAALLTGISAGLGAAGAAGVGTGLAMAYTGQVQGSALVMAGGAGMLGAGIIELMVMMGLFKTDVIAPDVRYDDKVPKLAANSKEGLLKIREVQVVPAYKPPGSMEFIPYEINISISEPLPTEPGTSPSFRASSFVMKYTLTPAKDRLNPDYVTATGANLYDLPSMSAVNRAVNRQVSDEFIPRRDGLAIYENMFVLRVGDLPLDVSALITPPENHALAYAAGAPLMIGQDQPSINSTIFRSKYIARAHVNISAAAIITQLEQETGDVLTEPGQNPQLDVFTKFVESIFRKAGADEDQISNKNVSGIDPDAGDYTRKLVQFRLFDDITTQIMGTLGREILTSPLLLRTQGTTTVKAPAPPYSLQTGETRKSKGSAGLGMSYIRLVDWAPIPTPDERKCGYDPHILALDTMKKRIEEDYKNMIECSPLKDEISVDGLGRAQLSSLEAAAMSGCVMTTLRAYGLEQLVRAMFPLSVFVGREVVTPLLIEFITEETLKNMRDKNQAYYEEFLIQVENTFASRMNEFSPYGYVPDVIKQSEEIGLHWIYAESAIKEYNGAYTGDEVDASEVELSSEVDPNAPPSSPDCGDEMSADDEEVLADSIKSETEQMVRSRLRFLVEEQIYSVLVKLQDLICFDNTLGFDDNFLARQLPLVDVQKEPGEPRFAQMKDSLKTMEKDELFRQFQDYSKAWSIWSGSRLFSLINTGVSGMSDLVTSTGTTFGCIGNALAFPSLEVPPLPEIEDFVNDIDWGNLEDEDNIWNFARPGRAPDGNEPFSDEYGPFNQLQFGIDYGIWELKSVLDDAIEGAFDALAAGGYESIKSFENSAVWEGVRLLADVTPGISRSDLPSLLSAYETMVEVGSGTYNTAMEYAEDAAAAAEDFLSDFNPMDTFEELGACGNQAAEEAKQITVGVLGAIANAPTPLSEFAQGLPMGTTDRMGTVAEFGARTKTEDGEGRFDNPIMSTLTEKRGMLMLERYIKVRSSSKDLTTLEPMEVIPTLELDLDLPPLAFDSMPANSAAAQAADSYDESNTVTAPPSLPQGGAQTTAAQGTATAAGAVGTAVGNNYVMQTFGTYQTEGDPFQGAQDRVHNPSLGQILAPREVLNTSKRLAKKPAMEASPNRLVTTSSPAGASAASLDVFANNVSSNTLAQSGRPIAPGTTIAPPHGVNLISDSANVSLVPKTNPIHEKVYNMEKWQEVVEQLMRDDPNAKFSDYFDEWYFGTRLVYVVSPGQFKVVDYESEPGSQIPHTVKVPLYPEAVPTEIEYLFNQDVAAASDAYMQFERVEVEEKVEDMNYKFYKESDAFKADGVMTIEEKRQNDEVIARLAASENLFDLFSEGVDAIGDLTVEMFPTKENPYLDADKFGNFFGSQYNSAVKKSWMDRPVTVIPLSSTEIAIELPNRDIRLGDLFSADGLSIEPAYPNSSEDGTAFKDLDDLYTRRFMSKTLNLMKQSPGYNLALKYCVPSNTLLSFATIYSNLLSELPPGFFDETKFELKNLFEILLNGGDYTFVGPTEKEKGSNRDQSARAQANMGTDGSARKPSLVDLALQTPKLIFKGLAEFMDPVIAPTSMIVKKAKAGEFYPVMLKNGDGSWYMLPVELKQYDLPPPLGAMPDPQDGYSYINETEGHYIDVPEAAEDPLIPGLSTNVHTETPVPNFTDKITGESLEPFLREYFFPLDVRGSERHKQVLYRFKKALVSYNFAFALSLVISEYMKAMDDPITKCKPFMIKKDGKVIVPVPVLDYPGDPIDIPITPLAMSLLPMDVMMGYGVWPPHTPLGWIYHAIEAAESLKMPTIEDTERIRESEGIENKKKPFQQLCIDVDQLREEDGSRTRENDAAAKAQRMNQSKNAPSPPGRDDLPPPPGGKKDC